MEEEIRGNVVISPPSGIIQRISAVLAAALAAHFCVFVALTVYLYPLYHNRGWHLKSDLTKMTELIPIIIIEYASIFLFWYVLFLWRQTLNEGRKPWFFRTQSWVRWGIIVLLAIITALAYYPFSSVLVHAGLTRVGSEHPIIQKIQNILIFLIVTSNNFFQSLVWLWWLRSAAARVRSLFSGICTWLVYDAIVMLVLEEVFEKHTFSEISRILYNRTIMDAKIGIFAIAVFIVTDRIRTVFKKNTKINDMV
ncbi:hypothetical protein LLG96_09655 [bacterium]|nr:hypothetical protein [bacterium]